MRWYSKGYDGRNRMQNGSRTVAIEQTSANTMLDAVYLHVATHGKPFEAAEVIELLGIIQICWRTCVKAHRIDTQKS